MRTDWWNSNVSESGQLNIWKPPYFIVADLGYPAEGAMTLCTCCKLPKILGLDIDKYSKRGKRGWAWRRQCRDCLRRKERGG